MASPYIDERPAGTATNPGASGNQPSTLFQRLFTDHPNDVDETYFEHLRAASSFAGGLAICTFCCFVHALVPGLFTTSASVRVERMHERMHQRAHSDANG